jgi:manganese/zinc/iron transport system substrate-binding protein
MKSNGKIKVLSTIAMIDDLVKEIGKEQVDSITLIKGELDPHSYQLVKGDNEKLEVADIIFYNGLGLEHGPGLQSALKNSNKAIPVGTKIIEKEPSLLLEVNGQIDPHIWMDISLWSRVVDIITAALIDKDPAHAEIYFANGNQLKENMMHEHHEIRNEIQNIAENRRYLVTSHDAFNYFAKAYLADDSEKKRDEWQKRFAAPEGLSPESQLSTTEIQKILDHLEIYHVRVLFPESNVSKDSIKKIVDAGKEKGLDLIIANEPLYGDAMGKSGSDGDTYLKMMKHNADTIVKYIK